MGICEECAHRASKVKSKCKECADGARRVNAKGVLTEPEELRRPRLRLWWRTAAEERTAPDEHRYSPPIPPVTIRYTIRTILLHIYWHFKSTQNPFQLGAFRKGYYLSGGLFSQTFNKCFTTD